MAAHPDTAQILQEGTRALEKHCPRAVAKIARLCGDIACLLPPATWTTGPDTSAMQVGKDGRFEKDYVTTQRSTNGGSKEIQAVKVAQRM